MFPLSASSQRRITYSVAVNGETTAVGVGLRSMANRRQWAGCRQKCGIHPPACVPAQECYIDFNNLSQMPEALFKLPKLNTLNIAENHELRSFGDFTRYKTFQDKLTISIDNVPSLCAEWGARDAASLPNLEVSWFKVFPDRVTDNLFVGSLRTVQEQRVFQELGITKIVTCGDHMDVNVCEGMPLGRALIQLLRVVFHKCWSSLVFWGAYCVLCALCTKSDVLFNPKYAGHIWKLTVAVDHLGNIVGLFHLCLALHRMP